MIRSYGKGIALCSISVFASLIFWTYKPKKKMLSVKSYLSIMRWGLWRLSRGDLPDSTRSIDIIPARINENSAMFWAVPRLNEVIWCRTIVGLQTSCERFGLQSSATDGSINRLCNLSRNVFELVPIDSYLSQSDLTTIHYISKWSLNLIHPNFYHMYLHLLLSIVRVYCIQNIFILPNFETY